MRIGIAALLMGLAAAGCAGRPDSRDGGRGGWVQQLPERGVFTGAAFLMAVYDTNFDGRTTRDELEAGVAAETERAFAGETFLRPVAFEAWAERALGGPELGPFRLEFDANVDGEITRAEFAAALAQRFATFDDDKDGVVTRRELSEPVPRPDALPGQPAPAPPAAQR